MNELIWKKNQKIIDLCLEKSRAISAKHDCYFIDNSKWGKRWNYYHGMACRLLKEQQEMLDEEERRLNER